MGDSVPVGMREWMRKIEQRIRGLEGSRTPGPVVGECKLTAGLIPPNWLHANGAAVSRTTYVTLFATIGTFHGVGNGTTTFNLPNLTAPSGTKWMIRV
jgi:phage-related tail fiber protein